LTGSKKNAKAVATSDSRRISATKRVGPAARTIRRATRGSTQLKRNGPELRIDYARGWIVLKDARQGEVHEPDDIAEIAAEFRIRQVVPKWEGSEERA
jgi:hypothetical protein